MVTASNPDWSAVFLPEFDGYTRDTDPPSSDHFVYRHYPGEGSFAMAWVVNRKFENHLLQVDWYGRAGSILLQAPRTKDRRLQSSVYAVGLHGGHGDSLFDSLTDATILIKRRPRHSRLVAPGDWSIDLLPSLSADPGASIPGRGSVHGDRGRVLASFCTTHGLKVVVPSRVVTPAGGPFGNESIFCPFTRIPVGEATARDLPSLLDYSLDIGDTITDSWIDWLPACGDHALMCAVVAAGAIPLRPLRGKWHCTSWDAAVSWMTMHGGAISAQTSAEDALAFFNNAQDVLRDRRPCAQRRRDRIPDHIRTVLQQAAVTPCERERRTLRASIAQLFREHRWTIDAERARFIVKSGRVFSRSKKLYNIEALKMNDGSMSYDQQSWDTALHNVFGKNGVSTSSRHPLTFLTSLRSPRTETRWFRGS